jgi:triphosphoribosyl-dephospho-CoA synthetase
MTPTTAREFAERLLDACSSMSHDTYGANLELDRAAAAALIEADRLAIREAAIRECMDIVSMTAVPVAPAALRAKAALRNALRSLLPPAEKAGPT